MATAASRHSTAAANSCAVRGRRWHVRVPGQAQNGPGYANMNRQQRGAGRCPFWAVAATAAILLPPLDASGKDISFGDWFTASNWTPAGVPTASDPAVVAGGVGSRATISAGMAEALSLDIATTFRGFLDMSGGSLDVAGRIRMGASGGASLGELTLRGASIVKADSIVAGDIGGSFMLIQDSATVTSKHMIVANGPAGMYEKAVRQYDKSNNTVHGNLEIGIGSAGSYENHGGTNIATNLFIGGPGSAGTGTYSLYSGGTLAIEENGYVGGGDAAGITGTLSNAGGTISGGGAGLHVSTQAAASTAREPTTSSQLRRCGDRPL
jgi:hypothetical protein